MIRNCPHCGAKNRIPERHLADTGRCGACKQTLPPLAEPLEVDTDLFEAIVNAAGVPVLVDFYATWCGPCKKLAPTLEEVAAETPQARVIKVDIDRSPGLAARYGVRSVPSLLVFRGGQVVANQTGVVSKSRLKAILDL